jgi:hypothetical protein
MEKSIMTQETNPTKNGHRDGMTKIKLKPIGGQRTAVNKAKAEIAEAIGMPSDDVEISVYYWE